MATETRRTNDDILAEIAYLRRLLVAWDEEIAEREAAKGNANKQITRLEEQLTDE